jgi:hypothetical protein
MPIYRTMKYKIVNPKLLELRTQYKAARKKQTELEWSKKHITHPAIAKWWQAIWPGAINNNVHGRSHLPGRHPHRLHQLLTVYPYLSFFIWSPTEVVRRLKQIIEEACVLRPQFRHMKTKRHKTKPWSWKTKAKSSVYLIVFNKKNVKECDLLVENIIVRSHLHLLDQDTVQRRSLICSTWCQKPLTYQGVAVFEAQGWTPHQRWRGRDRPRG